MKASALAIVTPCDAITLRINALGEVATTKNVAASNAAENKAARGGAFAPSASRPSKISVVARPATGCSEEIRRVAGSIAVSV